MRWLVIGGGTAGCVVAARLSERGSNDVTLLEAGPDHGADHSLADVGLYLDDPTRWHDRCNIIRRAGDPAEHYWQGRGLGGSSLLNGPVMVPNPADAGIEHLMPMEPPAMLGPLGAAVVAAAPGARPVLLARRNGRRVTAADAYLRPISDRRNLTVVENSTVTRLIFDGRSVGGAITESGVEHDAERVVVCAGAIHTPALLLASGVDTPGVGEGLQDHPAFAITLELASNLVDPSLPNVVVSVDRPGTQILAMNHLPGSPGYGALIGALMTPTSTGRVTLDAVAGLPSVELNQLATDDDVERLTTLVLDMLELCSHPTVRAVAAAGVRRRSRDRSRVAGR